MQQAIVKGRVPIVSSEWRLHCHKKAGNREQALYYITFTHLKAAFIAEDKDILVINLGHVLHINFVRISRVKVMGFPEL